MPVVVVAAAWKLFEVEGEGIVASLVSFGCTVEIGLFGIIDCNNAVDDVVAVVVGTVVCFCSFGRVCSVLFSILRSR